MSGKTKGLQKHGIYPPVPSRKAQATCAKRNCRVVGELALSRARGQKAVMEFSGRKARLGGPPMTAGPSLGADLPLPGATALSGPRFAGSRYAKTWSVHLVSTSRQAASYDGRSRVSSVGEPLRSPGSSTSCTCHRRRISMRCPGSRRSTWPGKSCPGRRRSRSAPSARRRSIFSWAAAGGRHGCKRARISAGK